MSSGIVDRVLLKQHIDANAGDSLDLVLEIVSRYSVAALEPSARACESALKREDLSIAVLGWFKAGKSSFLNHVVGRDVLPVGVIPITSVVTEMVWGAEEVAKISFFDGRVEEVSVTAVGAYVTEANNPENRKEVSGVRLYLPDLEQYKGLRFVDTPGLESAFVRNSNAKLFEYTPKVCVLLTKVDVLTETEITYSTRHGFEGLRSSLEEQLIAPALLTLRTQKEAIASHKLHILLRESADYLQLAHRSAEMQNNEKQEARGRALAGRETLDDAKLELQPVARHNAGAARGYIEKILARQEKEIRAEILKGLERDYSKRRALR